MGGTRRAFAEWIRRREQLWQLAVRLGLACLAAIGFALVTAIDRGTASYVLAILLVVELVVIIAVASGLLAYCKTDRR
jgi:hypothetical protein